MGAYSSPTRIKPGRPVYVLSLLCYVFIYKVWVKEYSYALYSEISSATWDMLSFSHVVPYS